MFVVQLPLPLTRQCTQQHVLLCLQPCTCDKDNKYVTFDARTCCPVAAVSVLLLIKFRPFFCLVFILSLSFVSCLCSLSTDLVVWNSTGWISVRFAFNSVFCLFTFFLFLLTLLVWNSTAEFHCQYVRAIEMMLDSYTNFQNVQNIQWIGVLRNYLLDPSGNFTWQSEIRMFNGKISEIRYFSLLFSRSRGAQWVGAWTTWTVDLAANRDMLGPLFKLIF